MGCFMDWEYLNGRMEINLMEILKIILELVWGK